MENIALPSYRSGRVELTPAEAKQLYDIVERGVPFPRYKLSKRRPILNKLMKTDAGKAGALGRN